MLCSVALQPLCWPIERYVNRIENRQPAVSLSRLESWKGIWNGHHCDLLFIIYGPTFRDGFLYWWIQSNQDGLIEGAVWHNIFSFVASTESCFISLTALRSISRMEPLTFRFVRCFLSSFFFFLVLRCIGISKDSICSIHTYLPTHLLWAWFIG